MCGNNQYPYIEIVKTINLMSVTELLSTLHLKDSVTFSLNTEFLNHNFDIVKQCLLRIKDIEDNMGKSSQNTTSLEEKLANLEQKINHNSQGIHTNKDDIQKISNNIGDDFMKRMYAIQDKTANMYDFDQTVRRLQNLDKFLLVNSYKESKDQMMEEMSKVLKMKEQFERYVPNHEFSDYKKEQIVLFEEKQKSINKAQEDIRVLDEQIKAFEVTIHNFGNQIDQNNKMIKEINFTEILERLKKQKEEVEQKVSEFATKLKKKVGVNELHTLEKSMIQKLDKFFNDVELQKAEKNQTKDVLVFLEKKINDLAEILLKKLPDEEQDALFSSKKWQCASCTKDLGKFEGKLGQYKPWSIFPCKEPDPEKSGGFGYLNYVDKMAYKRGFDLEDQNMERLNKTFNDSKQTPKKMNSTRASNLISNYGSEERRSSLKDHYFKEVTTERGERSVNTSKQFRVQKKEAAKQSIEEDNKSADVK